MVSAGMVREYRMRTEMGRRGLKWDWMGGTEIREWRIRTGTHKGTEIGRGEQRMGIGDGT
jgi:hypothetical protein